MRALDIKWSKDALEDLDVIWDFIADDSVRSFPAFF